MAKLLKKILKQGDIRGIAILTSGTFIAQLIGFIAQPVATRLYNVEDFGRMGLILSLVTMFSPIMGLQYPMCIVTAKSEDEANAIISLSLYVSAFILILIGLGLFLYNQIIPVTFAAAGNWIYVALPLLCASAVSSVAMNYNIRHAEYRLMSLVSIYQAVVSNIIKIVMGILKVDIIGLVASAIIGVIVGIKKQTRGMVKNWRYIVAPDWQNVISVAFKYRVQPMFSMPGIFAASYSFSIIPVLISSLYEINEVGYFTFSMTMLGLPLSLVSSNVGTVFFRNASKEKNETGRFTKSFKSTTLLLLLISIPIFCVLWFFSELLFSTVFGDKWFRSGTFVKLFIPLYFVRFTVTVLTLGLIISGHQFIKLLMQCLLVLSVLIIYYFTKKYTLGIEYFLTLINYSYMINYLILFGIIWKESCQDT